MYSSLFPLRGHLPHVGVHAVCRSALDNDQARAIGFLVVDQYKTCRLIGSNDCPKGQTGHNTIYSMKVLSSKLYALVIDPSASCRFPPSNEVGKYAREIELTRNAHIVLTQGPRNQERARIAPTKFYSVLLHRYVAEVEKEARRTKHASLYQF
jgi:hypothetical protein